MKPTHFVPRTLALFLSLALSLPNPAFALRGESAAQVEKTTSGLEEALRSSPEATVREIRRFAQVIFNPTVTLTGLEEGLKPNQAVAELKEAGRALRVASYKAGSVTLVDPNMPRYARGVKGLVDLGNPGPSELEDLVQKAVGSPDGLVNLERSADSNVIEVVPAKPTAGLEEETVILRTGKVVPRSVFRKVRSALKRLDRNPRYAFFGLVKAIKTPGAKVEWQRISDKLQEEGLLIQVVNGEPVFEEYIPDIVDASFSFQRGGSDGHGVITRLEPLKNPPTRRFFWKLLSRFGIGSSAGLEEVAVGILEDTVGSIKVTTLPQTDSGARAGPSDEVRSSQTLIPKIFQWSPLMHPPRAEGVDSATYWKESVSRHKHIVKILEQRGDKSDKQLQSEIRALFAEVQVPTVDELRSSTDSNARQLAEQAKIAGYSRVVLIPEEALSKSAIPEGLAVHLYAHEQVMAGAVAALPIPLNSIIRHTVSDTIEVAREGLEKIPRDQKAVVALDAAFKDRLPELLPEDHPLTFLLDSKWEKYMNYQREVSVLLSQPPQNSRNLVLYLSAGSVQAVKISGRNFTAIFA